MSTCVCVCAYLCAYIMYIYIYIMYIYIYYISVYVIYLSKRTSPACRSSISWGGLHQIRKDRCREMGSSFSEARFPSWAGLKGKPRGKPKPSLGGVPRGMEMRNIEKLPEVYNASLEIHCLILPWTVANFLGDAGKNGPQLYVVSYTISRC